MAKQTQDPATPEVAQAAPVEAAAPKMPQWRVTHGDVTKLVSAPNENDARAIFNDSCKKWPSPKLVKVEKVEG